MESYRTQGTCCREIIFEVNENNILQSVKFVNGCSGNSQGIARLSIGNNIDDIIERLEGIKCRGATSCPDQFAKALKAYKAKISNKQSK
jgi:uncharacterized protein (TIGR03905 family)